MNNDLEKLGKALLRIKPILEQRLTIAETAELLNISSSSVDKALQIVRKNATLLPLIDKTIEPNLFLENLAEILKNNTINGIVSSENISLRKPTWTESDALRLTYLFLANGYTLREAEEFFGYPKSTVHEILNSEYVQNNTELYTDVQRLLQLNLILRIPTAEKTEVELMASKMAKIGKVEKAQIQKHFLMQKYEQLATEKGYLSEKQY